MQLRLDQEAEQATPNLPATLPNIQDIVNGHQRAFELYESAFLKIQDAAQEIAKARAAIDSVAPGGDRHHDAREVQEFHDAIKLPERDRYLRTARKLLDLQGWHYVMDRLGVDRLMDRQAKDEFEAGLRYVSDERDRRGRVVPADHWEGAPPFTVENVRATIQKFAAEADTIWKRGIANAFSALDRRFRSHDGFKIGSRVIITHFVDQHGFVNRFGRKSDTMADIERAFCVLDGQDPRHAGASVTWRIQEERRHISSFNPAQSEHETEYFKVRIFKNGNAHLWFTRPDLVEKVNKTLAAHYGEVIGDGQTQEADPLENRSLTPARNFGFFPTPPDLAEKVAYVPPLYIRDGEEPRHYLEPSVGTGNLLRAAMEREPRHRWDCVEVQRGLVDQFTGYGPNASIIHADFLRLQPEAMGRRYDGVLMNPPFDLERDIDHVTHALKFLKPDGWVVSIMSAGTEFRETRKAAAFRKLLSSRNGWMVDLPDGAFQDVGTHVNTVLVGIGCSRPYGLR